MAQIATPPGRRQRTHWLIGAIVLALIVAGVSAAAVGWRALAGEGDPIEGVITYATEDGDRVTVRPDGEPAPAYGGELQVVRGTSRGDWAQPGGRAVAFVDEDDAGLWLAVWEPAGISRVTQLTDEESPPVFVGSKGDARAEGAIPLLASWSPDGGALAYGSARGDTKVLHIATRGAMPVRSYVLEDGYAGELAWSPDGRSLAISTYSDDGRDHTVYVIDRETGDFTHIVDGCLIVWSPDSRYLALHRDPHRARGIWLVAADGAGEARQVTAEPETYPLSWTLDGGTDDAASASR